MYRIHPFLSLNLSQKHTDHKQKRTRPQPQRLLKDNEELNIQASTWLLPNHTNCNYTRSSGSSVPSWKIKAFPFMCVF